MIISVDAEKPPTGGLKVGIDQEEMWRSGADADGNG
jgi:hypothetical protein